MRHYQLLSQLRGQMQVWGLWWDARQMASVQWVWMGVLARGVSPFHCQVRGSQGAEWLCCSWLALLWQVALCLPGLFFFFFCLSLGVTDLFVWVAETKCVDCDRCFFEQWGEADHTADICLVVRLPSAHLSFYSTFPFAPRMAPAASAVVLRVSFRLWVFLILFWLLVWSCWPFVLKKSVRTFGSPQWISLPCSAELILFLWLLTAVLVDIMEDVNKYA